MNLESEEPGDKSPCLQQHGCNLLSLAVLSPLSLYLLGGSLENLSVSVSAGRDSGFSRLILKGDSEVKLKMKAQENLHQ